MGDFELYHKYTFHVKNVVSIKFGNEIFIEI